MAEPPIRRSRAWSASSNPNQVAGLIKARLRKGWTQEDAAKQMGLTVSTYRKKERGEHKLSPNEISKAMALFGVSAEELLPKIEPGSPDPASGPLEEIDSSKLAELMFQSKGLLSALNEEQLKVLFLSLIQAARKP